MGEAEVEDIWGGGYLRIVRGYFTWETLTILLHFQRDSAYAKEHKLTVIQIKM